MASNDDSSVVTLSHFDSSEFYQLWLVALATYGVGDIVTTIALLRFVNRIDELNVIVETVVGLYGEAALVVLKFVVFAVAIGVSVYGDRVDDWVLFYLPPTTLAVIGGFTTAYNIRLFLG